MPLTNVWKKKLVKFVADATDPLTGVTTLWLSMHTVALTATATQSTSEATFSGYARISILRNTSDWDDLTLGIENAVRKAYAANTGSSQTVLAFGLGLNSSGAGDLILYGTINAPTGKVVATGDAPSFEIGDLEITG